MNSSNNNKDTIQVNRKRKKEIEDEDEDDGNTNDFSINPNSNNNNNNNTEDEEDGDDDEDNENNISNKSKKSDLMDNSINKRRIKLKQPSSKKRRSSKSTFQDDDDDEDYEDSENDDDDEDDEDDDTYNNTTLDESYEDDASDNDESDDDDISHGKVRRKVAKTKRQTPLIPPTQSEVDDLVNKSFNSTLDEDDEDDDEEVKEKDKLKMEIDNSSNNSNNNNTTTTAAATTTTNTETVTENTDTTQSTTSTNTTTTTAPAPTTTTTTITKQKQNTPPTTTSPQMSKQTRNKTNSPINTQEEQVNEGLYHCDYCQKDISGVVRIRCSVCTDFDLCLECFSVGVEITPHRNFHDYHVVDNMHFPMFTEDWGADEELLLLEAIELYGLGNWNEVSENVGAHSKSPAECKSHYFTYYLNSATSPIPDTSNILTTKENVHFKRAKATVNGNYYNNDSDDDKDDDIDDNDDGSGRVNSSNLTITTNNNNTTTNNNMSCSGLTIKNCTTTTYKSKKLNNRSNHGDEGPSGPVTDSVGFMKNRGHFEVEYDNEAEIVVKDLTFEPDDLPADREIKLNVLESYDQRLDERIRRRNFIVEKGLLDYRKSERKRFKDDKEILNSMKCFLQTISKEEHEQLINGLINEKNIKNRILQLQEYREQGIRTLTDGQNFDEDKRKRELDKNMKRSKSEMSSYMNGITNNNGMMVNGYQTNPLGHQYIGSGGSGGNDKSSQPAIFKTQKQITKEKEDNYLGVGDNRTGLERKHHSSKSKKNAKVEMEGLPNSDALSLKEKQLCTSVRLLPQQYLIVKEALIAESLKHNGTIKQMNANKLIKLPPKTVSKLLEYFEKCGWLQIKPDSLSTSSNTTTTENK